MQLYDDERELVARVASFAATGFEAGAPVVVIATPAHHLLFADALEEEGWSTAEHAYIHLDALDTLSAIRADGRPDRARFLEVIGGVLDDAASRGTQPPLAYGEMVDLLHARGQVDDAIALEHLWNDLGAERTFSLLCAYQIDVFDRLVQSGSAPRVCEAHAHVELGYDEQRLSMAIGLAMAEVLGQKKADDVYYIIGSRSNGDRIPLAQRALMWVGGYSPELADRVLEQARARYAV